MKQETKIIIFLLLLAPILGELVSGASPPFVFFNPTMFLIFVVLYGCGVLLIREAKVRWKLQWSVIFLAIAYAIIEEGLMMQTFFNPGFATMGALSQYGMYLGVQWVGTISVTIFHATISTLIPIAMVGLLWPKYKDKPLLKKKGLAFCFIGILLVTIAGIVLNFIGQGLLQEIPYSPNILLLFLTFLVMILFIWLAYKFKESRVLSNKKLLSPFVFGIIGFLYMLINLFTSLIPAQIGIPAIITVFMQFIFVIMIFLFVFYQIYNKNITKRHIVALIFGSVLLFIVISPINELWGKFGMSIVGIISLILLIIWRKKVLKKKQIKKLK